MNDRQAVIDAIRDAFRGNVFPGEHFLQGSFEGCEPAAEVGPFRDRKDWTAIESEFLDAHYAALSFFSEAGFRFFLPAYMVADLNDKLRTADPLFHLTHGFFDFSTNVPAGDHIFVIRSGKSVLINPRRYGAATVHDHARYRLSVFTREEAVAIAAYLTFKRDHDPGGLDGDRAEAALAAFWHERARMAPTTEALQRHLAEQEAYVAAIRADAQGSER